MKFIFLLVELVLASKVTEYRFGLNFGQTINDYSGNGRTGTNTNFKSTDRGVYIDGSTNFISLKNPSLPDTSSIIFWILPKSVSGVILFYGYQSFYQIQIKSESSELKIDWVFNDGVSKSGKQSLGINSFVVGTWKLVVMNRSTKCVIGLCVLTKYDMKTSTFSATSDLPIKSITQVPLFFQIGGNGSVASIQGFLWYFLITNTLDSYASYSTSTNPESCILNSCLSCSEKFIDPTYGNLCLSASLSDSKNKENSDCPSSFGCSFAFTYSCTCASQSCTYNQNTNKYLCLDSSTGSSIPGTSISCMSPFVPRLNSCCIPVCSDCTSPKSCITCIDPNAEVIPDNCKCKAGYYGTPSITSTSTCQKCGAGCSSCLSSVSCQSCYDLNSETLGGVCICKIGYAGTPANTNGGQGCITPCVPGCGECSGSSCISCADLNAVVNALNQCECKTGYSGTPSSSSSIPGCIYLCTSRCMSCDSSGACLSCFDGYSQPSGPDCVCSAGYIGTPSSSPTVEGCYTGCSSLCKICLNSQCVDCIDSLALVSVSGNCVCGPEAIGQPSSTLNVPGCQPCPSTRNRNLNSCAECKDPNAEPDASSNCVCKTGYFGLPSADSGNSGCVLSCSSNCLTCSNLICNSCKDINAEIVNNLCVCKNGFTGSPSSISDSSDCVFLCSETCEHCQNSLCLKCKDSNAAVVDGVCQCRSGFSGVPSSIEGETGCQACDLGCKNCPLVGKCDSCYDTTAVPVGSRCYCSQFMYLDTNNYCKNCSTICGNCIDLIGCTQCSAANSIADNGSCICKRGMFVIGEISEDNPCSVCDKDCETCENKDICLSCTSINATPSKIKGCDCLEGFWKEEVREEKDYCKACMKRCKTCDDGFSCTQCKGEFTHLDHGECVCDQGFYFADSQSDDCIQCRIGDDGLCNFTCGYRQAFYLGNCTDCPKDCYSCDQLLSCTKCLNNESPVNGICECPKGKKMIDKKCKPKTFEMSHEVTKNYEIYLKFKKMIEIELQAEMISLKTPNKNVDFIFKKLTNQLYKLILDHEIVKRPRLNFTLSILHKPFFSIEGEELAVYNYSFFLNQRNISELNKKVSTVSKVAMGAAFTTSMVSNPATCWIVLNTIQLITYLPIASINFSQDSLDFFKSIGSYNTVPNFIDSLISDTSSEPPEERIQRVGIETSVFWVNFGKNCLVLIVYIALVPVILFGMIFRKLRMKCLKLLQNYRFSLFIRFFIQTYLEICLFSFIQISSNVNENFGYFSLGTAFLLMLVSALAPFWTYLIIIHINPQNDAYTKKYGSLFEEFKNDGKKTGQMFYVCFFIRRFEYSLSQVLLFKYPKLQTGLNLSFSIVQLGYLLYFRPFKDKLALISEFLGEICVLIAFSCVVVMVFVENREVIDYFEIVIQWTIVSGIGLQIFICAASFFMSIKEFYVYCKKRSLRSAIKPNFDSKVVFSNEPAVEINDSNFTNFK